MNLLKNLIPAPPLDPALLKPTAPAKAGNNFNKEKLRAYGAVIAQTEITKQIGALGIESCLAIGVIAESIIGHYRDYLELTQQCIMDTRALAEYFAPEVYAQLTPNQIDILGAAMRQEHQVATAHIKQHMALLQRLVDDIEKLGPAGQRELFKQRRKMQGFTEEEIAQELAELQEGGQAA